MSSGVTTCDGDMEEGGGPVDEEGGGPDNEVGGGPGNEVGGGNVEDLSSEVGGLPSAKPSSEKACQVKNSKIFVWKVNDF